MLCKLNGTYSTVMGKKAASASEPDDSQSQVSNLNHKTTFRASLLDLRLFVVLYYSH